MKKKYEKPMIAISLFELQQNIAAGCGTNSGNEWGTPNHGSKTTCGWDIGDNQIIWIPNVQFCNEEISPDENFDGVCYNNFDGGFTIFAS